MIRNYDVYNVDLTDEFLSGYTPKFLRYNFLEHQKKVKESLDNITKKGVISATDLEEDWFPNIECDIFISHSHKDKNIAIKLAKWIFDNFKLKCFIDSMVWGYSDELIKKINEKYSKIDENLYEYEKVINATNHVNMILMTAILKVIDSASCVFFLNTPDSISSAKDSLEQTTNSPWIYSEIMFTYIIDKNRKRKLEDSGSSEGLAHSKPSLKMDFELPTEHMTTIYDFVLETWKEERHTNSNKLAILKDIVKGYAL